MYRTTNLQDVLAEIDAGERPGIVRPVDCREHREKNVTSKVAASSIIGKMPVWDRDYDDIRPKRPGEHVSAEDAQLVLDILRENGYTLRQRDLVLKFEERTGRKHSTAGAQISMILYFLDRTDLIWPSKIVSTRDVIWMSSELAPPRRK